MKSKRIFIIDFIRATAVILMVVLHSLSYYLSINMVMVLWDYLHFAVPFFVFSAGTVIKRFDLSRKSILNYLYKRLYRLLIPYYCFLFIYLLTRIFILHKPTSFEYLIGAITTTGSIDLNWLILLFIQLTFITPIILLLEKKGNIYLWGFTIISFLSSVVLLLISSPTHYQYFMWIPWSYILIFGMKYNSITKKKLFVVGSILFAGIHILSFLFLINTSKSTTLFNHKYPPDIYYLSYGLSILCLVLAVSPLLNRIPTWGKHMVEWVSRYSYAIFFVHAIILVFFEHWKIPSRVHWFIFCILVWGSTVLTQYTFSKTMLFLKKRGYLSFLR